MSISTTFGIALTFLVPALVLFFFPYKDPTCFVYDDVTPRCVGISFASILLSICIITTAVRLGNPERFSNQKIDLSDVITFKNNDKPRTSDIYSTLVKQK